MKPGSVLLCVCLGCIVLLIQYRQNVQLASTVQQLTDERVFAMTSLYGVYATFHGDASVMCTTVLETVDPIMERVCEQRQVLRMAWKELCSYQHAFQTMKDKQCMVDCRLEKEE